MPLFGKKHDKQDQTGAPHQTTAGQEASGLRQDASMGRGTGAGSTGMDTGMTGMNPGAGQGGRQNYDTNMSGRGAGVQQNMGAGDPYAGGQQQGGMMGQADQVGQGGQGLPPTNHYQQPGQGHKHAGTRTAGKMESAVGALVGSTALQARGQEKEQEAQAIKSQSSEIAEAERLEREAIQRRERAVAHGAHPDNRHLGGRV
ncbi:hypothetical protein FA95DRAFT_924891 [Auriscalpium vulgare]|uniref:Uncharacterized protein n=1 Tax=Auriscalpium vulgare TaxID=40419 RepID=A0ACB8RYS5_9AGAM|nr:hypothetical protein FA95DRAFT_924891 [Auriscalpium vulgare]